MPNGYNDLVNAIAAIHNTTKKHAKEMIAEVLYNDDFLCERIIKTIQHEFYDKC